MRKDISTLIFSLGWITAAYIARSTGYEIFGAAQLLGVAIVIAAYLHSAPDEL